MKVKKILAVLFYVFIVTVSMIWIQNIFVSVYESKDEARLDSAFKQEENSLDAVFLGPSTTYASWVAPIAFDEYGIAVYSMASAAQPLFASKYMIEDMRRTQPDALYIINVTHYLIDYEKYLSNFIETYPLTINKLKMSAYLCNIGKVSLKKMVEIFFPIIKYHDRWSEITYNDLFYKKDKYKSASHYTSFLKKAKDVGSVQHDFLTRETLTDSDYKGLVDIMNYCKKENIRALFVVVPQGEDCSDKAGKQNTTISILQSRGFDVLDLRRYIDEMGLDPKKDFYNAQHMNINGAEKVTRFLSEYLTVKYGFADKRGDNRYSDWTHTAIDYRELLQSSSLKSKK